MYHSVGLPPRGWAWSNLSTPPEVFEDHLRALAAAGYRSVSLADLHAHKAGQRVLPERSVVLTFDDGYLDNWCFAAPLLQRHGFTGTVLVTPDFVQPDDSVRPTLPDVEAGRASREAIAKPGFMSWEELRRVSASGVLSVQCHAMTHTWYPVSDEVVDFHHPGDAHYWLDWNAHPETKPYYLTHPGNSRVPYGVPVYAHEKSLACRRYHPEPAESEHLAAWVESKGGRIFFTNPEWRGRLQEELGRWRKANPPQGRHETEEERAARLRVEIVDSGRTISERIGQPVEFFVWPGGGYEDQAMGLARETYRAVTIRSAERWELRNLPGEDPGVIVRRGVPLLEGGGGIHFFGGSYLVAFAEEYRGSQAARRRRQLMKLGRLAAMKLRRSAS